MPLIVLFLVTKNSFAGDLEWPKADFRLKPGECASNPLACYGEDSVKMMILYKAGCDTWKSQAMECSENAKAAVRPASIFRSKWFWFTGGVILGSAAIVAVTKL